MALQIDNFSQQQLKSLFTYTLRKWQQYRFAGLNDRSNFPVKKV
jgi:hypothetical protein